VTDDDLVAAAFHRAETLRFAGRLVQLGLVMLTIGVASSLLALTMSDPPGFVVVAASGAFALLAGVSLTLVGERLRWRNAVKGDAVAPTATPPAEAAPQRG
jgi:hypothetical protein